MLWIAGAVCMILFGALLGYIGLALDDMLAWAIVGGILVLVGIFLLVWYRRSASTVIVRDWFRW